MPAVAMAGQPPLPAEAAWLLGTWRSDVALTMANYTFQDKRPDPQTLQRISEMFGKMTHTFTPTAFIVEERHSFGNARREVDYRVDRLTDSTVSLSFAVPREYPDMTLYRGDGWYSIRAGRNFEYFRQVEPA